MSISSAGMRRLCAAVDLEAYSRRDNPGQSAMQRGLADMLQEVCQHGAPRQAPEAWQPQGDGALGVLPPGADETRAVADLLRELRTALHQHNRDRTAKARLRIRVAMHSGIVHDAANGFAGDAVVVVHRLLDAPPLRAALRQHPETDLALIVSDQLFDDVIKHNYRDLRAETFQRVRVNNPQKRFTARAWIHVTEPAATGGPAAAAAADPEAGTGGTNSVHIKGPVTVQRDWNLYQGYQGPASWQRTPGGGGRDA